MNLLTNGFMNNCGRLFGPSEQFEADIDRRLKLTTTPSEPEVHCATRGAVVAQAVGHGVVLPSRASSWFRSLRKRESQNCRAKPAMVAQHRDARQHLSMRHLRLTVHDSQTTQELGIERDDDR